MSENNTAQKVIYTNWRGETAERTITPITTWFGSTEWHPEPQYFVQAWDHGKGEVRDFALKDFGYPAPTPPGKPGSSDLREAVARAICEATGSDPDRIVNKSIPMWKISALREADAAIAAVVERCAAQCDDLARGARKLEAETEHKSMGRERAIAAECLADEIRALARKE